MAINVSPGVYASERDFSLYAPQLAQSILGIVTTASKGPVNQLTLITDEGSLVKTFGPPSSDHLGIYAGIRYLRKGRQLWVVRVGDYQVAAEYQLQGRQVAGGAVGDAALVSASSAGSWGNTVKIKIEASTYYSGAYKITVYDGTTAVEVFDNCTTGTPTDANYWVSKINTNSEYVILSGADDTNDLLLTGTYTLAGGDDGSPADADSYVGIAGSPPAIPATGLQLFRNPETIDVNLLAAPGISNATVIEELISICEARGDCMCLIDPPSGKSVQQVVDWHNGSGGGSGDPASSLSSSYAALFWPWVKVYDGFGDEEVWVPPSGHVAGVMAFTDLVADPWWAPAGVNRATLSDVIEVEHSASQGERDYMYTGGNAVNPIVSFHSQGTMIWGQRTLLRSTSSLDRINTRRMMLYLRKVIATAVRSLVFEPNDEVTWRQFVNLVEPVCQAIQARRGLYGFKVICDETTNTPEVVARNEMLGRILLQPTKTAEVISMEFVLLPTGASFEEIS